ncbi:hypothetical protein GTNG_1905 [Geobacillus thermodenitrificans NG80-2]|uniref:Uncharacterized protein n=1 Tax=Geobacillus thermodenitrificans (strain NG80-2) TaxID=420246 RepID=A4IPK9_GEOTN|nr:hypothetical protein GTNG_1905 [Geobacillus thermodenitrificans NG80-2]
MCEYAFFHRIVSDITRAERGVQSVELARKYIHIHYTKDKGGIARKWFTIHEIKKNDKKGRQGKIVEKV